MTDVGQGRRSTFSRTEWIPAGRSRLLIIVIVTRYSTGFLRFFLWKRYDGLSGEGRGNWGRLFYRWFEKLTLFSFMGNHRHNLSFIKWNIWNKNILLQWYWIPNRTLILIITHQSNKCLSQNVHLYDISAWCFKCYTTPLAKAQNSSHDSPKACVAFPRATCHLRLRTKRLFNFVLVRHLLRTNCKWII